MNDLISRRALLIEYERYHTKWGKAHIQILTAPGVDAKQIVHGMWEYCGRKDANGNNLFRCSICDRYLTLREGEWPPDIDIQYCQYCGSLMDKGVVQDADTYQMD